MLTDKELAREIVNVMDQHQASWSDISKKFEKGRWWHDNVEPLLNKHNSPFAKALKLFAQSWPGDTYELCKEIANSRD